MPKTNFKRQLRNLKKAVAITWSIRPRLFVARLLLQIVEGLLPIALAYISGRLIDAVVDFLRDGQIPHQQIYLLLVASALLGLGSYLIRLLLNYFNRVSNYYYYIWVQQQIFDQFARLDHSYYESSEFNKQLTKVEQNRFALSNYAEGLLDIVGYSVQVISASVALSFLNPWLTLLIVAALSPSIMIESAVSVRRWRRWDDMGEDWRFMSITEWLLRDIDAIKEIKIFSLGPRLRKIWNHYTQKARYSDVKIEREALKQRSLARLIDTGVNLGVQIWLLLKVLARGSFGLGDFQFYRSLVQNFSSASNSLLTQLQRMRDEELYVDDIFNLLELKPKIQSPERGIKLSPKKIPHIEVRNISFRYPGTDVDIFKNFSLTIEPGEDVALVGENGAGKTTLIKLLMRFYDVTEGQILLDGHDIKEVDLPTRYYHVGILFQDFIHYSFTASENIGFGRTEHLADSGRIKEAAKTAGASGFIEDLEHGYDQILNRSFSKGIELSGGQWQRVALARAFFRDAGILILDEPTSAIDAKGEYEIFKTIARNQQDKTTLIISHRFSTVRNAHKIYVVDKGKIIESGTHEQLMQNTKGKYKEMFELQAEGYK